MSMFQKSIGETFRMPMYITHIFVCLYILLIYSYEYHMNMFQVDRRDIPYACIYYSYTTFVCIYIFVYSYIHIFI